MATALKTLPKFCGLTAAQYTNLATKDANTLYFVFDAGVNGLIYRGSNVYGETIRYVSAVPEVADALKGVIYFNTTDSTAYVKSGSEMKPVGVLTVDAIDDSTTDNDKKVPNVGAVKNYVKSKITSLLHFKGVVDTVADLPTSGNAKGDVYIVREVEATPYQPAKTNVEYVWTLDTATGDGWEELGSTYDFSIFVQKKTSAVENNLSKFDSTGDVIDSGFAAGSAESIPASASASATVLPNEKAVATSLEAEATARSNADATKQDKDTDAVVDNAAKFDAYGNTIDAGKKYGADTDTISSASPADTLATEKAVAAAITSVGDNKQDKDTDAVVDNAAKFDAYGNTIDADRTYGADSDVITSASAANALATEKAVATAIAVEETRAMGIEATKQDKDTDAVAGDVAVFDAYGNSIDGGKVFGTDTIVTAGADANTLATEEAVVKLINQMAWQTVE